MKLSSRELVLGWATGFLVLFGVTYIAAAPKIKVWKGLREEQVDVERRLANSRRLVGQQQTWETRLAAQQKKLPLHPADKDVTADAMIQLENIAKKTGLTLLSRDVDKETRHGDGDIYELAVNCKWEGNLSSIISFLFELQQDSAMLDANQLSVAPNERRVLKGNITVSTTYARQGAPRTPPKPANGEQQ